MGDPNSRERPRERPRMTRKTRISKRRRCVDVASALALSYPCIRVIGVIRGYSFDHAFKVQLGVLEVQKQGQFQVRDMEITQHLGDMRIVEPRHDLGVGYDKVI